MERYEDRIILKKGEVLLREGEKLNPRELYIVSDGVFEVFQQHKGSSKKICEIKSSELIGEISFFTNSIVTATVVTKSDEAVVFVYNEKRFNDLISRNHKIALKVIHTLADRLKRVEHKYHDIKNEYIKMLRSIKQI